MTFALRTHGQTVANVKSAALVRTRMTASIAKYLFLFALVVFGAIRFPRERKALKVAVARSYYGWREWVCVSAATW